MEWKVERDGGLLTVSVDGRFTACSAPAVRDGVLSGMVDGDSVLFDLSRMTHIDSSGLGVLVQILQKARHGGGDVVLAGIQPGPRIVFGITKVSRVFDMVPALSDAQFRTGET